MAAGGHRLDSSTNTQKKDNKRQEDSNNAKRTNRDPKGNPKMKTNKNKRLSIGGELYCLQMIWQYSNE